MELHDMENATSLEPGSDQEEKESEKRLYYSLEESPPWYLTLFLGLQHYVTMASSTIATPLLLAPYLCISVDDVDLANLCSTIMFLSGLLTLLQSTLGTRLPIIQGGSFAFTVPVIAILTTIRPTCPNLTDMEPHERTEVWQVGMRQVQGAIILASLVEVALGFFGVVGIILKYITPLTVASAITMIGLSLFKTAAKHAASNWWISMLTMVLIILFSQYCARLKVPVPFSRRKGSSKLARFPIFQVFPVLFGMVISWMLCYVLTEAGVLGPTDPARTDLKLKLIGQSEWIRLPYPFQWGFPTVSIGAIAGVLCAVLTGTVESIGDYYACSEIVGAKKPPTHAMNRGIFVEGLGCVMAGMWGTGTGTTSYSGSIGALALTKVGSRTVVQTAGLFMILFGLVGKVGAFFVSIPEPVVGGVFCVLFATIAAVGLSNLQDVDLNSQRNLFVIGFSIFFALTVSEWVEANPDVINTGFSELDQIISILLRTGMFLSGLLGFVFDNTIPGTPEERGLVAWTAQSKSVEEDVLQAGRDPSYDLPLGMGLIERMRFLRRLPVSPTFK